MMFWRRRQDESFPALVKMAMSLAAPGVEYREEGEDIIWDIPGDMQVQDVRNEYLLYLEELQSIKKPGRIVDYLLVTIGILIALALTAFLFLVLT